MADRLSIALEREARIRKGERQVQRAAEAALAELAMMSVAALEQSGMDESVLDVRWPDWVAVVADTIEPVLERIYREAYDDPLLAAAVPADQAAADHLFTVRNRVVGIGDDVFRLITAALDEGRGLEEDIPTLAKRVQATLDAEGAATWRTRARTIARTEVIGAHNAGHHEAAAGLADSLGEPAGVVAKEWLATADARTRPSHTAASGQTVVGLGTPFSVGGAAMEYPGDPAGPAKETINCRCTVLYHYPGDPDYPADAIPAIHEPEPTPGALTRDQYASMAPESQWSAAKRDAIHASIATDANGKALIAVLDRFQDGGSIARLRGAIEKRMAGATLPAATVAKVDALADAIRHAPSDWAPDTLYRGMTVPGVEANVMAKYVPGEKLDLSLTSFSSDRAIAKKFQSDSAKRGPRYETRIMVELVGEGKHALPIQNMAADRRLFKEKEWVTMGRFRIVEVKKSPSGGLILRVQQESAL